MPERKGPGRPKLPTGKTKLATLTIRVTEEERKFIRASAEKTGQKLSEWARKVLIAAADR